MPVMMAFAHVLCPTDLSDTSRPALGYAAAIAHWYGARLTVLHVVPTFDAIAVAPDAAGASGPVVQPPTREEVEDEVRRTLPTEVLPGIDIAVTARAGDPTHVIADQARETGAELIVMSTHGRSGFKRLLTGSVAESVLRVVPCPVLVVPPHASSASDATFRRILCAVDFSPMSKHIVAVALDLGRQANGRVTVLHAWHVEDEPRVHVYAHNVRTQLEEQARDNMRTLLAGTPGTGCDIDEAVVRGTAQNEILRMAHQRSSDLIVIGAQSRSAVGLVFLGSTTQHVVRSAECPVLVVRGEGRVA
jgi:nucleotide-binding universal stress UspA family protein